MIEALRAPDQPHRRVKSALPVILGVALGLRLAFVLWYPQAPIVGDALFYDQEAVHLALGQDATFSKGPVYPLFLAAIYRLVGHHPPAARVVQALMSSVAVLLIYALGKTVFGRSVAVIASVLAAVYPPFISYSGCLLTETLSVFLLLVFVSLVVRAIGRPGLAWWTAAGLLGGITILHREEMLLMIFLAAAVAWRTVGRRQAGVVLMAALLMVLPWTIRNYKVSGEFMLVHPGGGQQLWVSTYEKDWGLGWPGDPYYRSLVDGVEPLEVDRKLRNEALKSILTKPGSYLRLCLKRIPRFWLGGHSDTFVHFEQSLGWYLAHRDYGKVGVKFLMLAYNLGMLVLGFTGGYLAWRMAITDSRYVLMLAVPVVAKAAFHVFVTAGLRYQVPIMSFLILFAAVTVWHVRRVVRELIPVM